MNDHEQTLDNKIFSNLYEKNLNIILCTKPFVKLQFLNDLIDSSDMPVIFLDFDMLYSGYIVSQIIPKNKRVEIFCPNNDELIGIFSKITKKVSENKCLIIVDSLNGFYDVCDNKESGIFINAMTTLLNVIAKQKNSIIVVTAVTSKKDNIGWILSPEGRHIFKLRDQRFFQIDNQGKLILVKINEDDRTQESKV